jgi:anaerobic ribonucleoside-triphosphate reductase
MADKCDGNVETYARVCGFMRPVQQWNKGKREEFRQRQEYAIPQEVPHVDSGV